MCATAPPPTPSPTVLVVAGQTLKMLVHMSQAKRVLEIGMFTGYGALSMAEGLPEDGCLVACELEPYLKDFARPLMDKSPHGRKISVRTGSAMDTLQVRGFVRRWTHSHRESGTRRSQWAEPRHGWRCGY